MKKERWYRIDILKKWIVSVIILLYFIFASMNLGIIATGSDLGRADDIEGKDRFNQLWFQSFVGRGEESAQKLLATPDGGFIIAGETNSFGGEYRDIWLIKTDAKGDEEWNRLFGDLSDDEFNSIEPTSDGGYVILGTVFSDRSTGLQLPEPSSRDIWLIKTDATGNIEWERTYGNENNDIGTYACQTSDSGYIIAYYSTTIHTSPNSYPFNPTTYIMKTSDTGEEEWNLSFHDKNSAEICRSILETSDNGFLLITDFYPYYIRLTKLDSNGVELWNRSVNSEKPLSFSSMYPTFDNGYLIFGFQYSKEDNAYKPIYLKLNENGYEEWNRTSSANLHTSSYSNFRTRDGGYIVAWEEKDYIYGTLMLTKLNDNCTEQWRKKANGSAFTSVGSPRDIVETLDGGYAVVGDMSSGFGTDIYLFKTDSNGTDGFGTYVTGARPIISSPGPFTTISGEVKIEVESSWVGKIEVKFDNGIWFPVDIIKEPNQVQRFYFNLNTTGVKDGEHTIYIRCFDGFIHEHTLVTIEVNNNDQSKVKVDLPIWLRTFGNSFMGSLLDIFTDRDGGFIIGGNLLSTLAGYDAYLTKLDLDNNTTWDYPVTSNSAFSGIGAMSATDVVRTTDGGYCVLGNERTRNPRPSNQRSTWLTRLSWEGDIEWHKTFDQCLDILGLNIQQTKDEGFVVTGAVRKNETSSEDVWLLKVDDTGKEQWNRTYGTNDNERGLHVQQTQDDGYIITGNSDQGWYDKHAWLIKTDSYGMELWNVTYNEITADSGMQMEDGGYILAGTISTISGYGTEIFLLKIDQSGIIEWFKEFGGPYEDRLEAISKTQDGGLIIAGISQRFFGRLGDIHLIKTDSKGVIEWEYFFGGEGNDNAYSIREMKNGTFELAVDLSKIEDGSYGTAFIRIGEALYESDQDGLTDIDDNDTEDNDSGSEPIYQYRMFIGIISVIILIIILLIAWLIVKSKRVPKE